jgi:hypothetical protein
LRALAETPRHHITAIAARSQSTTVGALGRTPAFLRVLYMPRAKTLMGPTNRQ